MPPFFKIILKRACQIRKNTVILIRFVSKETPKNNILGGKNGKKDT
ncbi:MAG: hypothetical protein K0S41_2960 [Anaerocolumna sp.]|jgi:hypothetical protein|nr:hypothetical protein [Anaerocolumna sp.]